MVASIAKVAILFGNEASYAERNISLSDQFDSFIATGIEEGRYGNATEVVRQGLRLLQQREAEDRARISWLRGAAQEGIDATERGDFVTLDSPARSPLIYANCETRGEPVDIRGRAHSPGRPRFPRDHGVERRAVPRSRGRPLRSFDWTGADRIWATIRSNQDQSSGPSFPDNHVYPIHVCPLASSRERVVGDRVKTPRHFLLYRVAGVRVAGLRILHDSRDLLWTPTQG